jgi:hypothetical protein
VVQLLQGAVAGADGLPTFSLKRLSLAAHEVLPEEVVPLGVVGPVPLDPSPACVVVVPGSVVLGVPVPVPSVPVLSVPPELDPGEPVP